MNLLHCCAGLCALSCLATALPAGETIGTYFDAAGTQTSVTVAPLEVFDVYFICDNIPAGVAGYEFYVNMPPELLILSVTAHPVGSSLDIDSSNEGFIVGTGSCLLGPGPIVMGEFRCLALAPATNLAITLSPVTPSSFGGTATGYAECNTLALFPFADAYPGPAIVNIGHEGAFCFCDGSGTMAPCGNLGAVGHGCANSFSAAGARLDAEGLASAGASTLVLLGSGVPPNKPGLFFQGTLKANGGLGNVFGDGLLCAGGSLSRLEIVIFDAAGVAASTSDLAQQGAVVGGDLRYYQLWYRDPVGSPCGNQFNTSNALEITWMN
jgi:hypothetical protein